MSTVIAKNFSTGALAITMAIWSLMPVGHDGQAFAQTIMPTNGMGSRPPKPVAGNTVFLPGAPDTYVVQKGDTLWGIAGKFLSSPWRWPEVWKMNRTQIKNPHWIYPGQTIVLDKINGTMSLQGGQDPGTVYLHPAIRVGQDKDAIRSIPQNEIEPFLSQPLIVEADTLINAPRVVASKSNRVILGRGDSVYVQGITDPSELDYQIFQPAEPLTDPVTEKVIGYQAEYLGSGKIVHQGEPATLVINSFEKEIEMGSRLVPAAKPTILAYVPHAPDGPISGAVVTVYNGVGPAGKDMIIVLNRGSADGLETGNVVALKTLGRSIVDKTGPKSANIKLPDENNGLAFVFRVFGHLSYALILNSDLPVDRGDVFTQP